MTLKEFKNTKQAIEGDAIAQERNLQVENSTTFDFESETMSDDYIMIFRSRFRAASAFHKLFFLSAILIKTI